MRTFLFTLMGLALMANTARGGDDGGCTALPTLQHTESFIGSTMTVSLINAPADSGVVLFYSPVARRRQTPFGRLELDRTFLSVVDFGVTGPDGAYDYVVEIPGDVALAETEAHYQALVTGSAYPHGAILSQGTHMRLAGPRVYATWLGDPVVPAVPDSGENAGLAIVSALDGDVVAEVDLGPWDDQLRVLGKGRPVFCPVCTLGAIVARSDELTVFDPHFGGVVGTVPFEHPSRTISLHPDGLYAFVLETGYRTRPEVDGPATLHKVSLCGLTSDEQLELPFTAPGPWVTNPAGTQAYIAELGEGGRTAVRLVDLVAFEDLGAVDVGGPDSERFSDMKYAFGRVFVSTRSPDGYIEAHGELSRVRNVGGALEVDVSTNWEAIPLICPVPAANTLVAFDFQFFIPSGHLRTMRPGDLHTQNNLLLPWVYLHCDAMVAQDAGMWIVDRSQNEPPSATDPGRLYHYGFGGSGWSQHPTEYFFVGPVAIDLVRDAYVDRIVLATHGVDPPVDIDPALVLIDKSVEPAVELSIPFGARPDVLHGVPVP